MVHGTGNTITAYMHSRVHARDSMHARAPQLHGLNKETLLTLNKPWVHFLQAQLAARTSASRSVPDTKSTTLQQQQLCRQYQQQKQQLLRQQGQQYQQQGRAGGVAGRPAYKHGPNMPASAAALAASLWGQQTRGATETSGIVHPRLAALLTAEAVAATAAASPGCNPAGAAAGAAGAVAAAAFDLGGPAPRPAFLSEEHLCVELGMEDPTGPFPRCHSDVLPCSPSNAAAAIDALHHIRHGVWHPPPPTIIPKFWTAGGWKRGMSSSR